MSKKIVFLLQKNNKMIVKNIFSPINNLILLFFSIITFAQTQTNGIPRRDPSSKPMPPTAASQRAGAFIDVNAAGYIETGYNISQLVENVLISGGSNCATSNVNNISVTPNLAASNQNRSWGFFHKGSTNFPFNKGIVLATGNARETGNTFNGLTLSSSLVGQQGDQDLATALGINNSDLRDATYIEFDFIPTSPNLTFRYLFASEDYEGSFPCTFADGFALLLKKVGDPNYTNLAVLPNGAGPVLVTNVRPSTQFNGQPLNCPPMNPTYFAGYNTNNIETNFSGRTVPLTAQATVIPGQTYHIKMVLADFSDTSYNSAVFLEAGSFDIGVEILGPNGQPMPSSINVCDNAPQTLSATIVPNATYQWFLNNVAINGATSSTYTATQPGVYKVEVTLAGNNCPGTASITIVGGTSPVVQNSSLTNCFTQGNSIYNLTNAQNSISTTPGATFSYYANQADANAGNNNTIANPTAYSSPGNQTIYVLVKNGFCSKVAQLQLLMAAEMTVSIAAPPVLSCTNQQATLNANASTYPAGTTFIWSTTNGNILSGGSTLSPTINAPGVYTLTLNYTLGNTVCTKEGSVTVTGDTALPTPGITASKLIICQGESVTLTATGGVSYIWTGLTGSGNTQIVTPATTTAYSVNAVGANGCVSTTPASITIEVTPQFTTQNASITACYQPNMTFDLTSAQPQITNAPGILFSYYVNLADANAANNNTIPNPTTFSSTGNQTIYVLATNGGCKNVVNLQLIATATTQIQIANPTIITCTNPQITINASGSTVPTGATIQWTTANGNIVSGANTLNPIVNTAGTYTLTMTTTSANNLVCTYTGGIDVVQDTTLPITTLNASAMQICPGESVTLTAGGGATYTWTGLPGNGNTQIVTPATTTTYTVNAIGANGCVSANPISLTITVAPPNSIVSANKTKICAGESVILTAGGGVTYNWVGLTGNGNTQTVSPTVTTTYSVFALGGNGCFNPVPATITVEVVPAITSTLANVIACKEENVILDAGSGPSYTYLWNTGATTQTINTNLAGTYTVTINNGVCSKVFSAQIINPELPQFTNIVYSDNTLTVTATNPSGGTLEYSIDGGFSWQTSITFTNVAKNNPYKIRVRVVNANCYNEIEYFTFSPNNAITPNGDGKNDILDFSELSKYKQFSAAIYDRYGTEIFKAQTNNYSWNGTWINTKLPTGTYWYKVTWENPASKKMEQRTGWILLKNRE